MGDQTLTAFDQQSLKRQVRRVRKRNRNEPEIPDDNSFALPPEFCLTSSNSTFLLADNDDPDNRIIVFAADWALDLLEATLHWGVS